MSMRMAVMQRGAAVTAYDPEAMGNAVAMRRP